MHSRLPVSQRFSRSIALTIVASVALCLAGRAGQAMAQSVDIAPGQKGGTAVETLEMRAALEVLQKQLAEQQERTAELEHKQKVLAQSLAASNAEAETHRKAYADLLIKLEGLGVDILDPDPQGLQSRLLKAVNDRQLLERELDAITDQVFSLTEAFVSYMQTASSDDASARQRIENELLAMEKVFRVSADQGANKGGAGARAIAEGKVVSRDSEIALVVLDIGKNSGVRIGMPLEIVRVNRPIGSALVVDVRDSVCGALVHDLISSDDDAQIGDRVRPRADSL
jgi:hypothetical protein